MIQRRHLPISPANQMTIPYSLSVGLFDTNSWHWIHSSSWQKTIWTSHQTSRRTVVSSHRTVVSNHRTAVWISHRTVDSSRRTVFCATASCRWGKRAA